jgi:NitT/TauT family transport system ATP-binding protein
MQPQQGLGDPTPVIRVENLSKSYEGLNGLEIPVLKNVSFEVQRGEILGIFGPSGCGKTTLLKILCGISDYEGDVEILGRAAIHQKDMVAYVPQRAELLEWRTLRSNALLGYQLTKKRRGTRSDIDFRSAQLFEQFRLADAADKYPLQCSGGERQRAALIRAFLTPANIIALDEPAGAIDHISRARIYENLLQVMLGNDAEDTRLTVLIISHDPEELLFLCDRILIMPAVAQPLSPSVSVGFTRPRRTEIKFSAEFAAQKRLLWESIR